MSKKDKVKTSVVIQDTRLWRDFKTISKIKGLTINDSLNMLVVDFVKRYKEVVSLSER